MTPDARQADVAARSSPSPIDRKEKNVTARLTAREPAVVLAALRYWRQDLAENEDGPISQGRFDDNITPLTIEEIDDLCESLNSGPATLSSPDSSATTSPKVHILMRNESDHRVLLGVLKSDNGARQAIAEDREELDGLYDASDYDIIRSTLDD
jgi:hypothetical protein